MTDLPECLRRAQADLTGLRARFCMVGGLAVGVRTRPRFTADLDLAVAVATDAEAEALVRALSGRGYRVFKLIEQQATGRLATVRLLPPGNTEEGVVLDLLFASTGIEPEIVAAADTYEVLPGIVMPIARREHLIAMKVLSRNDETRPQDRVDLVALVKGASQAELEAAPHLLDLITSRGCQRDRNLRGDFERLLRESGR